MKEDFHEVLKKKIHQYIMGVYRVTHDFPKHEQYGVTSQLRRAVVSVMLNYVEGFARMRGKSTIHFYEMSYASLKETVYLMYLSKELDYLDGNTYNELYSTHDEIGAMLYKTLEKMRIKYHN